MVTKTVQMPSTSGIAAAASEPNTASNTIRTIGRFHFSACGDVVLGRLARGGAERALPDDVELDPAVVDLAGLITVDADLGAQLLGHVDAAAVEVRLQRDDVGAVGLRRRLLRVGHHRDVRHFAGDALQLSHGGAHVLERRIRAGRRDQRQRGGSLVGIVVFGLVFDVQRL